MPPQQDPRSSATDRIREQLRRGAHRPGAPLPIADLAHQLGLSPTPIREALAHLAGEGMVVERRGFGYFVEGLDAESLIELYDLHQLLVVTAVRSPRRRQLGLARSTRAGDGAEAPLDAIEAFFSALTAAAGNAILLQEHRRLSHRLAASRSVETAILGSPSRDLAEMARLASAGDASDLVKAIIGFHQKRTDAASDIVAMLRSNLNC
jgi:DNA-binding GntR family transcriptional regulator